MRLTWHSYKYYPYERDLAAREITALLGTTKFREVRDGIELGGELESEAAERLTYFSGAVNGHGYVPTIQAQLELGGRNGKNKQATRYSVHGLHEYKGKFNPQVVRAVLNIFEIGHEDRVLDPFCGSGTTLVECSHLGVTGLGTDINPLAVYMANAKLQALRTPAETLESHFKQIRASLVRTKRWRDSGLDNDRGDYLKSWFDWPVLTQIETIRIKIEEFAGDASPIFLTIASNLLRDYSLQDPNDLRIRRRKSPLPEKPFFQAFLEAVPPLLERVQAAQNVIGTSLPESQALLKDVTSLFANSSDGLFDAAITSPPYAMALPYIDTQRLSLVWLCLLAPERILELESELIGSREMRGDAKRQLPLQLRDNTDQLPEAQAQLCLELYHGLSATDGFRRQAVPALLYRYFSAMKASFKSVRSVMKRGAPYGLIVGRNHTTIGGVRRDIDTPLNLTALAKAEGWKVEELIPLQTYHRYGYHVNNAVVAETLIILRNQ